MADLIIDILFWGILICFSLAIIGMGILIYRGKEKSMAKKPKKGSKANPAKPE